MLPFCDLDKDPQVNHPPRLALETKCDLGPIILVFSFIFCCSARCQCTSIRREFPPCVTDT
ncbi:hypothetical protein HI914_00078 [Erysiphe necator]|nr:hypothetical protein HI914_00078 [Erysiphe necator]